MIENGICHITYPNGKMSLVMEQFFPTSAHNIRLLFLKTIALNWEDRQQTADDILHWLKEAHRELDAESVMKFRANKCVDQRTKAKEMQSDIDRQALKIKNLQDFIKSLPRGQKKPYQDFHTANFMIPRQLMEKYPFDLRFHHYGYEDVLFGMQLEKNHIPIHHIDNPLSFEVFEDNDHFLSKTEEGLRTLYTFRQELKAGSRLLQRVEHIGWLLPILRLYHQLTNKLERRFLLRHPSLFVFSLYRLGYYATLNDR